MKIRIRFLIVAVLLWHHLSAPAVTVTERLQWNDAQQTANLPPTGDALWHTAGKAVDRGWESGTLWLRMRVQAQAQEDLYLALRHVNVDDLAVGVQLPTSSVDAAVAPPASLQAVDAHDVQAGKLLLRADHSGPQEVIVWIRARGAQVRWFEADVVGSDVLMQQRASDAAITAMQLTFSALLLLVSLALWSQSRKPVFAGMGGLGLLSMLFQLQCSGSFIAALGQDLQAYVRLNNALALVLGCAGLYASAAVVASPRFRLRYQSALHAALASSVLLTLVAYLSGYRSLNLVAAALLSLALYGFCGDCLRHWWQHRNWRQGWGNRLLSAVFLLMVLANLDLLSHLFVPSLDLPWVDAWRPLTMPLLSWSLLLTLLWRQYRSHAVQERRRHEAEVEANNGVFWRAQLLAVPAPEGIASDKGIKRAADKVPPPLLPCWRACPRGGLSLCGRPREERGEGRGAPERDHSLSSPPLPGAPAPPRRCCCRRRRGGR